MTRIATDSERRYRTIAAQCAGAAAPMLDARTPPPSATRRERRQTLAAYVVSSGLVVVVIAMATATETHQEIRPHHEPVSTANAQVR